MATRCLLLALAALRTDRAACASAAEAPDSADRAAAAEATDRAAAAEAAASAHCATAAGGTNAPACSLRTAGGASADHNGPGNRSTQGGGQGR